MATALRGVTPRDWVDGGDRVGVAAHLRVVDVAEAGGGAGRPPRSSCKLELEVLARACAMSRS